MFTLIDGRYQAVASKIEEEWLSDPNSSKWYKYISDLGEPDKATYVIMVFHNQVENGGLHQYFSNSYGQFAKETIHLLKQIKAFDAATILERALGLVKPLDMPFEEFRKALRKRTLRSIFQNDDIVIPLDDLDKEYYSLGDEPLLKLEEFLRTISDSN
ncbi:DMP19 family protein [Haloferula sargassicola]|uniref:DNA mimic protein DMP19 C-terminal domain-containing protein n=1 Tax=Haloferula sargassicola TaxID=490096 RepID=A0ABP9UR77_9BACT